MADSWAMWLNRVQHLMASNQVPVGTYRYTRPAPSRYEHQWLWDSCFHAIIYRHFDAAMARDELLSVIAYQVSTGKDAGMLPHMTYWRGGGASLWGEDGYSIITQPPLVAVAAQLVYEKTQDIALLSELYSPLCLYHLWFERRRDPDQDHLASLIHPWESGWDSSPRWDAAMQLGANPTDDAAREARKNLVTQLIQHECDAVALRDAGLFYVEVADFNAIRAADLESLAWIAAQLQKPDDAQKWRQKAASIQQAIQSRMIHDGQVYDLAGRDEQRIAVASASEFVVLFGGGATPEQAQQLVARLEMAHFQPKYPVPTTPTDAPIFDGNRYWRGNVWVNVNWLIWKGLLRYGYTAQAQQLAQKTLALVEQHGFHEYFNPHTGAGFGSFPHSWTGIVLDMVG
jgi:glycogen debranching enzyme